MSEIKNKGKRVDENSEQEDNILIQFILIDCEGKIFLPKLQGLAQNYGTNNV